MQTFDIAVLLINVYEGTGTEASSHLFQRTIRNAGEILQ